MLHLLQNKKIPARSLLRFFSSLILLCAAIQGNAQTGVAIPAALSTSTGGGTTATGSCVSGYYAAIWGSGTAYWLYTLNTAGYSNIQMSFHSSSSGSGPTTGSIYYNAGAGDVLQLANYPATACTTHSTSFPIACNNVTTLQVKLKMAAGSSGLGTNRVDGSLTSSTSPQIFTGTCSTPNLFTVSATSSCVGSSVTLSGSDTWASYTLKNGSTTEQTITGTGSALTFTVTPSLGTYTILATNIASGCTVTAPMSGSASITTTVPTITTDPGDAIICSGDPTSFTAVASGALSYQWQKSTAAGGTTYANITSGMDGGIYGASYTTSTLAITGATLSENNFNYRMIAVNACGNSIPSSAGNLTVNTCVGNTITTTSALYGPYCNTGSNSFNVAFTSTGTYSGTFNAELSDATGSFAAPAIIGTGTSPISVVIPAGTAPGTAYRIRVSNTAPATDGTDNGSDIVITGPSAGGTASPDQSVCPGITPSSVSLTGNTGAVLYWQYSSSLSFTSPTTISGTAGLTTLPGATIGGLTATTYYQAVVQNGTCPSANSSVETITVNPSPTITVTPDGGSNCSGTGGLTMTASGASTYVWAPATGLSATTGSTVTANSTSNITYTVTGSSSAGCLASNTATVNYFTTPLIPVVTPASLTACAGSDTTNLLAAFTGAPSPASVSSGLVSITSAGASSGVASSAVAVSGVPSGASVTGISVTLDFTSNYLNDYIINLVAPNGDILNLINKEGPHGPGSYTGTIISSTGTTALNTGLTPFTATFAADAAIGVGPSGSLSTISSWPLLYNIPNGSWTLIAYNSSTFTNTATLTDWSININYTTPTVTWAPFTNLYSNVAGTTAYGGTVADSVYLEAASATTTTYTVTAANGGCTSSATTMVTVNPTPNAAITGSTAICNGGSAVISVAGGSPDAFILLNGGIASFTLDGTGTGSVSVTPAATTTYTASVTLAGCSQYATNNPTVTVNPLPAAYNVTGTGSYCSGTAGTAIGLDNSDLGINYQLYDGATAIGGVVAGTAAAISFGTYTAATTYTVVATNAATGCTNAMNGSATVTINPLPTAYNVTGTGSYCSGGAGATVGLDNSDLGINYQLYDGTTAVGPLVAGAGTAISFGTYTTATTYTVVATDAATGCSNPMNGGATVSINPLPTLYNVTGTGSYCSGGTGLSIGLDNSDLGTNYQLYDGATAVGSVVAGNGSAISFGTYTNATTYTVVATNATTGCVNAMSGGATITINPLPTAYNVTGTGSYCSGGTGVTVGLDNSDPGINYQLYDGATVVGSIVAGTGSAISFGTYTDAATYTVVATNTSTGCINNMTGGATVTVSPLPAVYNVTGTGSYCSGGTGLSVGLGNSDLGINYQLYDGATAVGSVIPGTGAAISFGAYTTATTYTVVATNTATGCINSMSGSATVTINPLPTVYNVTGTGNYCSGGTGVSVGLDNSDLGINYQLFDGVTAVGSMVAGTGSAISFGSYTTAATYTVVATDATTGCNNAMNGGATVAINPLPTAYNVTGTGSYCSGGTGVTIGVDNSDLGISYQLYNGASAVGGSVAGSGAAISFGTYTAAATYTVAATNVLTGCASGMSGGATVTINPLPTAYNVTGTGSYCSGGTGVSAGLDNSDLAINYQLYNGATAVGSAVAGTGSAISFGTYTAAATYTVVATNTATGCTNAMNGDATITINPLPTVYSVTGTGGYCSGGTGVAVGLNNTALGTSYQLYNGASAVGSAIPGTGLGISFGTYTAAATYTVMATSTSTGCTNAMSGAAVITIHPLPAVYNVTGTGSYCSGGTGVTVGLDNSDLGISYQLYDGATAVGSPVTGAGSAISFGTYTAATTYSVVATNVTTGCTSAMNGSATVNITPLPATYNVTGTGNYCSGGTGIDIGLDNSDMGISYQLYDGATAVGSPVAGAGSAISFGTYTAATTYTVVATNTTTGCMIGMNGSATITIDPLPTAYNVTGTGSYCSGGSGVAIGLDNSDLGIDYQLYDGATAIGAAVPGAGSAISFGIYTTATTYSVVATNATTGCINSMHGGATITINPLVMPSLSIDAITTVCAGTPVNFMPAPVNGGVSPAYKWFVNGVLNGTGATYSYVPASGDIVYAILTSDAACVAVDTAISDSLTITVNPVVVPSVSITASADTVCPGSAVTLTAIATNGGTSPMFQWKINGLPVATGSTYAYLPANGDVVSNVLTSTAACAAPAVATSDSITLTVDTIAVPVITIAAVPGTTITSGMNDTLTATVINGGAAPTYHWFVNSTPIAGATTATFIDTFSNNDSVSCIVINMDMCGAANYGSAIIHVSAASAVTQLTQAGIDLQLLPNPNNGSFVLKGTLGNTRDAAFAIEIIDLLGQSVYKQNAIAHQGGIYEKIQLSNALASGMYLLNVHSGSNNTVFHFVLKQ